MPADRKRQRWRFPQHVKGALVTGCRYGELTRMRAADFNAEAGTITVRESKSGKPRHVVLTDEGHALFAEWTAGRTERELVFLRDDGEAWGLSHQQRPLDAASARAKVEPAATFHILRHTYASALAMKGVPMGRDRSATRSRGHPDDGTPLRAPVAELRRRHGSRGASGAGNCRENERAGDGGAIASALS